MIKHADKTNWYKDKPKYGNIKTTVDGIPFDSKKEAEYYQELMMLKRGKVVAEIERQVPFSLLDDFTYNGQKFKGVKYYADFIVTYADGHVEVVDVKSEATKADKVYQIKKKMLLSRYPDIFFREM